MLNRGAFAKFLVICAVALGLPPLLHAQTKDAAVEAAIDTRATDEFVRKLASAKDSELSALYKSFSEHPDIYQPLAFHALAYSLYQHGKKGEAAFWYSVGKLRAEYDTGRCRSPLARGALVYLESRYPELSINLKCKYERMHEALAMALTWDEKYPYSYDRRWVNFFASSENPAADISQPSNQWPQIRQRARSELSSTLRALSQQGQERWNSKQRVSAKKGLEEYENNLKRAKAENDVQLQKRLEQLSRARSALEACLRE